MSPSFKHSAFLLMALLLLPLAPILAGPLTPPGPPQPTFKTLDEIATGTPIAPDSVPFLASEPGPYYLTGNIQWTGSGPVLIALADDVTFDLRGFTIDGLDANALPAREGILFLNPARNGTVRNGTIRNMGGPGVQRARVVEDLTVINVRTVGIATVEHGFVSRCFVERVERATDGGGATGINGFFDSTIEDCKVTSIGRTGKPGFARGILVSRGMVFRCHVFDVRGTSFDPSGILMGQDSIVQDCLVDTVEGTNSAFRSQGISATLGGTVRGNVVKRVMGVNPVGIFNISQMHCEGNYVYDLFTSQGGKMEGINLFGGQVIDNSVTIPDITSGSTAIGISVGSSQVERNLVKFQNIIGFDTSYRGIQVHSDRSTIINNRVSTDIISVGVGIPPLGIHFLPQSTNNYAAANIADQPIQNDGAASNILGTIPTPNLVR